MPMGRPPKFDLIAIRAWRETNKATIAATANNFGCSHDVVYKACPSKRVKRSNRVAPDVMINGRPVSSYPDGRIVTLDELIDAHRARLSK